MLAIIADSLQRDIFHIHFAAMRKILPTLLLAAALTSVGFQAAATEQVRVGNLETPELPLDSQDEIGILARSFRAMLEELKEKAALEQYVASLNAKMTAEAETVAMSGATHSR